VDRMKRISEMLKREISFIIQSEIDDPRIREVTVTEVDVSRDLRNATVFCLFSPDESDKDAIFKGLKSAGGFIRGELARRVEIKFVPRISFAEDRQDKDRSLDDIFEKIEAEQAEYQRVQMEGQVMEKDMIRKIVEVLRERDDFLITAHVNPEGDSVGSQIALWVMLEKMGKNAVMVQQDPVPSNLRFLKGSGSMMRQVPEDIVPRTVVMLDCPIKERTGKVARALSGEEFIINIDHHVSNEYFGDINWVEPGMSSVGEMVFHLAVEAGVEIDTDLANPIYTAILTDTGMFNYSNTSRATHEIAGKLISFGADPQKIHGNVYESKTFKEVRLLGRVLTTMEIDAGGEISHMVLTRDMYREEGIDSAATDEFINFPRSIEGVEVAIFFKEDASFEKRVNISFRSKGKYDVNTLASRFGGGGHPKASGCVIDCSLEEAREKVLAEARRLMEGE
jgi:bifunctional oligoribonuclease and PAP phosphatase NrnA